MGVKNVMWGDQPYTHFPNIRDIFIQLLPLLDEHGIGPQNIRRRAYVKYLEDRKKGRIADYKLEMALLLMREIHEIIFVLDTFVTNNIPIPGRLLRAAFSGHPIQSSDPQGDRSRNYMLHLRAATYFLNIGYAIILDDQCDVVAEKGGKRYFVECKRLYSEKKVMDRVKEAYSQLTRRLDTSPLSKRRMTRGIVWVDPSPILLRKCRFYMAATRTGASLAARHDLVEFHKRFIRLESFHTDKRVLALILQMIWASQASMDDSTHTGFTCFATPGQARIGLIEEFRFRRLIPHLLSPDVIRNVDRRIGKGLVSKSDSP